tara:strand:- start:10063 stop:10263 length:201 start_codon:yes stop_codon:yes gene_type:complete
MKIVIKEITVDGDSLLVYQMTNTNQPISCVITTKENLNEVVESISNKMPQERYSYIQYIKQDEITE